MTKYKLAYDDVLEVEISQCAFCKHKQSGKKCNAFDRIPEEILTNQFDHRNPYGGDNNIQFEANDNVDQETIDRLFE